MATKSTVPPAQISNTIRPVFISPPKTIKTARLLAKKLNCLCVLTTSTTYKPKKRHRYINWGNSFEYSFLSTKVLLNEPSKVKTAVSKINTFNKLKNCANINIPAFTTNISEAQEWLDAGYTILGRKDNQHGGAGITIHHKELYPTPLSTNADFWVQYIKKSAEYRIHVFNGKVIDCVQKRKRIGKEVTSSMIRNHANGWIFCRNNVTLPDNAKSMAIYAIESLGLNFGAVDLIYNKHYNKYYVLEINTAPGLEGTTLEIYATMLKDALNGN